MVWDLVLWVSLRTEVVVKDLWVLVRIEERRKACAEEVALQ